MRKLTAGLFITLDGVTEAPDQWQFPYWSDQIGATVEALATANDAILLGRVTYQDFVGYWPHQGSDVPLADFLNDTPKYVVSTTLDSLEWRNSTLINGDVMEEIRNLKQQPGGSIGMTGSSTLVRSLLRVGLLDELHLLVHPVVVGQGKRLFTEDGGQLGLELVEARPLDKGVIHLAYRPAEQ